MRQSIGSNTPATALLSTPIISSENEQKQEQAMVEGMCSPTDPELRHRMISEGAYYRYVARGYSDGYDLDDWLKAEAEVDQLLVATPSTGKSQ